MENFIHMRPGSLSTILLECSVPEVQANDFTSVSLQHNDFSFSHIEGQGLPTGSKAQTAFVVPSSTRRQDRHVVSPSAVSDKKVASTEQVVSDDAVDNELFPHNPLSMNRLCCSARFPSAIASCTAFPMDKRVSLSFDISKSAAPPTTMYTEFGRSFTTCDVSMFASQHDVLETVDVVVNKDDGRKTINDYLVIRVLGKGSYSKIKLVEHLPTGMQYAMKVIYCNRGRDKTRRSLAIKREISVMKGISHPHLVRLREVLVSESAGKLYLVMQYINGGSIAKRTGDTSIRSIPEDELRKYTRQILSALKYLHVNGVIHRDIKPDNILVDEVGNAYLSDFGVSAMCSDDGISGVEGTPAYMAPELCRGALCVTGHLVDVWALGVSLFELLYGFLPFCAPTQLQLNNSILNDTLIFPDESKSGAIDSSPEFKEMLRGMLEKNPENRWGVRRILDCAWLAPINPSDTDCSLESTLSMVDVCFASVDEISGITPATA